MGINNAFISVDKLDESFIGAFDTISFNEAEQLLNNYVKRFGNDKTYICFTKLFVLKLVLIYKQFLNEKKQIGEFDSNVEYESEFFISDFESKIVSFFITDLNQQNNSLLKMMRITKDKNVNFGTYVGIYAIALHVITNSNPQKTEKQADQTNKEIIQILSKVRRHEGSLPFSSAIENKTIGEETNNKTVLFFENTYEFLLFLGMKAKAGESVEYTWKNGTRYLEVYTEAYKLNEQKMYDKGLTLLEKCLELNPIGITARFELIEVYIQKKNYEKAKSELEKITQFISTKKDVARYYRRHGYIAIEEKKYELALACFVYSLIFEKNKTAADEIRYLSTVYFEEKESEDPFALMRNNGIKLYKQDMKECAEKENINTVKSIDDAVCLYESVQNNIENASKEEMGQEIQEDHNTLSENNAQTNIEEKTVVEVNETDLESNKKADNKNDEPIIESIIPKVFFCRICGKKIPTDSTFCPYCGTKVIY